MKFTEDLAPRDFKLFDGLASWNLRSMSAYSSRGRD